MSFSCIVIIVLYVPLVSVQKQIFYECISHIIGSAWTAECTERSKECVNNFHSHFSSNGQASFSDEITSRSTKIISQFSRTSVSLISRADSLENITLAEFAR
jgi:hypothetical protein